MVNSISAACAALGLTINLKKTVVMYQPAPSKLYVEPLITVNGQRLENVPKFVYLGSTLSAAGLDDEISYRISRASSAFGRLDGRLWRHHNISSQTKVKVYNTCVLPSLLYGSEAWVLYRRQVRRLERFHQFSLRKILGINWKMAISDLEVLERSGSRSIESMILQRRLRWGGHLVRMSDERLPKQLLYGELEEGRRPAHKPKLRFKDCLKKALMLTGIGADSWERKAHDRDGWRRMVHDGCLMFERERVRYERIRKGLRCGEHVESERVELFVCVICGRRCLSRAGLVSHHRTHRNRPMANSDVVTENKNGTCVKCGKVCLSDGGLKRHARRKHKVATASPAGQYICFICNKVCKSLAGLKSHVRASHDNMHEYIK